MTFCEDEISFSELFSEFNTLWDKFQSMDDVSVLQGIAIAREINNDITIFMDRLTMIGIKSLVCKVLENYDVDSKVEEVQVYITNLFTEFTDFDSQIASISKDGFESLEEVERAVSPIFDNFITKKEDIEKMVDDELVVLFQPLIELGASQSQIENALEEIEFNESPTQYIIDVFVRIVESTLETL